MESYMLPKHKPAVLLWQMRLISAKTMVWGNWRWQVASWSLQMQQVLMHMHMPNKAMLLDSQPYGESACNSACTA